MDIRVYKVDGFTPSTCLGIIDDYESFNFTKSFKKVGDWKIKGYLNEKIKEIAKPGNMIYVNERIAGVIDGVEFETNEENETTYELYGKELKNVLSYRALWNNFFYLNDEVPTVEQWMRLLVISNCMQHPFRSLVHHLDTDEADKDYNNIGTPLYATYFEAGKNLLEELSRMCGEFNTNKNLPLGFDIVCKNAHTLYFTLYEGQNRTIGTSEPIILSREFDNLANLTYTRSNKNTCNVAAIIGNKKYVVTESDTKYAGFARRERLEVDDGSLEVSNADGTTTTLTEKQYLEKLKSDAYALLNADVKNLTAKSVTKQSSLPDFSLLGAKVTITDREFNVTANDWISEINFIDEGGEIETNYSVGEDIQAKILIGVR